MTQPLADWTATAAYQEALRENWARDTVAAAGKSWSTHMAKFSGTVLRRTQPTIYGIRGHQVTTAEEDGVRRAVMLAHVTPLAKLPVLP